VRVVLAVVRVLRLELLGEERALGILVPGDVGELLLPRAGVDVEQEVAIGVGDRPQARSRYGRAGKTPWRAMLK
jgi:hypothetical protein